MDTSTQDVFGAGLLGGLGQTATVPLSGRVGCGFGLPAGLVGTVTPQFSFDGGATFWPSLDNPPIILPLVGNSASGSLSVPGGATHAQLSVSAYTSGSTLATLRATVVPGPARVLASGRLVAASTPDYVAAPFDPTRWASATITTRATANASTLLWEMMVNGQWVAAPYATLTSTAAANPSTAASIAYTTTAADTWDLPLPGNATQVRVRCSAFTSGTVSVTVSPGRPYVPGVPVTAVLYDVTSAANTAIDTGVLEVAGWASTAHQAKANGGVPAFTLSSVDTAGLIIFSIGLGATAAGYFGGLGGGNVVGGGGAIGAAAAAAPRPRRVQFVSGAIVGQTSRVIIEATR